MSTCCSLREEFRLHLFGFGGIKSERLCSSQWRVPVLLYLSYRLLMMLYVVFWLGYTAKDYGDGWLPWGAFLTNWTYTLLVIYFTAHFLAALFFHLQAACSMTHNANSHLVNPGCCARSTAYDHALMFVDGEGRSSSYDCIPDSEDPSSAGTRSSSNCPEWYLCVVWVIFNAVSASALMVTIVYFVFLFPKQTDSQGIALADLQVHLMNSVVIVIEHLVTGFPSRLLHVIYPFVYCLIYLLFSVVFWAGDHTRVMYPDILDWNKPGPTILYVLMIGFIIIPLLHAFFFLMYKARMAVYRRC